MKNYRQKGFTLLELVVAVLIFGIISVLSLTSMVTIIKSFRIVDAKTDVIGELQFIYANLIQDTSLLLPKSIRYSHTNDSAEFFFTPPFEFERDDLPDAYFGFLRLGTPNATFENRSNMQTVFYIFKNNTVTRYSWQRNQDDDIIWPSAITMLTNVDDMTFEFENTQGIPQDAWLSTTTNELQQAPEFIRTIITFKEEKPIERWFVLNIDTDND